MFIPRLLGVGSELKRPPELLFWLDERPSFGKLIFLGLQYVVVICPYLVLVAIVANAAGLDSSHSVQLVGMSMVAIVLHSFIQTFRFGPIGSGFLAPPVVSAIYLPAALGAAAKGGIPLVIGMIIFAGICEVSFSRIVARLRKVFPAVVSGIILMSVGIELGKISLGIAFDERLFQKPNFGQIEIVFFGTVTLMVALSVWGKGYFRLFCALIGIFAGYCLAGVLGLIPASLTTTFSDSPIFQIPFVVPKEIHFDWTYLFPFALAGVASGLRTTGVLATCQQINDASGSKLDTKRLEGGVLADGIGCAIGGVFASPGLSVSPSLIGVEKASGVTSRSVIFGITFWLLVLACLPKLAALIVHMPQPVMGAVLFFNGSFMFVGGMQVAFRRPVTIRETFTIGFSTLLVIGVTLYGDFFSGFPEWVKPIASSPIAVGTLSAVFLNLFFLIARRRKGVIELTDKEPSETKIHFREFFEKEAEEWKIPKVEFEQIRDSVIDLVDQIVSANANESPVRLAFEYDDFDLKIKVSYKGELIRTRTPRSALDPIEEQAFISGLSGWLSDVRADKVEPFVDGDRCRIRLTYFLG
ncbi:MAG: solute carrier family 23 protein [Verrucomicrobiota bacterium]